MAEDAMGQVFAEIHGQEPAVERLRRALETGRIAHAYAFVGPAGSGRRATALAFARALVAPEGGPAADRVVRGVHPDVHLVQPTPPEGNPKGPLALRIDSIREIERRAGLRPAMAPFKVFIVDEADRMTAATPQAFLKTLEEPPARTVIILVLSRLGALPATVLSRCQIVRFTPPLAAGAVALLPDGRGAEVGTALSWLDDVASTGASAIPARSEALARDRGAAERVIEACWLWYRDLLCCLAGAGTALTVFGDRQAALTERARVTSLDQVVDGLRACREAWQAIQGNVSPRLSVEVLLSRLAPRGV
jgi:DNA polymerase-3 subunit delta'